MKFANKRLSKRSRMRYEEAILYLKRYLDSKSIILSPTSDTAQLLQGIENWLSTIDNSNTFNIYYFGLKSYLTEMFKDEPHDKQKLIKDFFASKRIAKPKKYITDKEYLTLEEIKEVIRHASDRTAYLIRALFQTG